MPILDIRVLGPAEIRCGDHFIHADRAHLAQNSALLIFLAVEDREVSRRQLLAVIGRSKARLRDLICRFRAMESVIQDNLFVDGAGVRLNPADEILVDLRRANTLYEESRKDVGHGVRYLEEIIELYRGDFLEGNVLRKSPSFASWQAAQCELLRKRQIEVLLELVDYYHYLHRPDIALVHAENIARLDPLHETGNHLLILTHAVLNADRSAAIEASARYERLLKLVGREPGKQIMLLRAALHNEQPILFDAYRTASSAMPPLSSYSPLSSLSSPSPPDAGASMVEGVVNTNVVLEREEDFSRIADILRRKSICAIVGAAGLGKTMLARRAVERLGPAFQQSIWHDFSEGNLREFLLSTLDRFGYDGRTGQIADAYLLREVRQKLVGSKLLLVLDGIESIENTNNVDEQWSKLLDLSTTICEHSSSRVILVSRYSLLTSMGKLSANCDEAAVQEPQRGAALEFLRRLGLHADAKDLEKLLEHFGSSPLELTLVAGLVKRTCGGDTSAFAEEIAFGRPKPKH